MNKKIIFFIVLFMIPLLAMADDTFSKENMAKILNAVNGNGILEDWFMKEFREQFPAIIQQKWSNFIILGQALAGAFALIYISYKINEILAGEAEFKILPLCRPVVFALLLANWVPFVKMVQEPFRQFEVFAEKDYVETQKRINTLNIERFSLKMKATSKMYKLKAQNEAELEKSKLAPPDPVGDIMKGAYNFLVEPLLELKEQLQVGIQSIIAQLFETICLWLLRFAVYGILLLQIIYSNILIILGPITIAFSLLPAYKSAFTTWLSRFISVELYTTIAFLILSVMSSVQQFGLESEIERLTALTTPDASGNINNLALITHMNMGGLTFGSTMMTFLLTAMMMMTVPTIAGWVIPTQGAGSSASAVMGKAIGGASMVASVASGGATKLASVGTSAAKAGASATKSASKAGASATKSASK